MFISVGIAAVSICLYMKLRCLGEWLIGHLRATKRIWGAPQFRNYERRKPDHPSAPADTLPSIYYNERITWFMAPLSEKNWLQIWPHSRINAVPVTERYLFFTKTKKLQIYYYAMKTHILFSIIIYNKHQDFA